MRVNDIFDPARLEASPLGFDLDTFGAHLHQALRALITAIVGYSDMLLAEAADGGRDGYIPDLQRIRNAAQQFLLLINDTVNFSPLQAMTGELDQQTSAPSPMRREMGPAIDSSANVVRVAEQSDHSFLLVVDDNEINCDVLSRRLVQRGYRVAVADG
jgi:signal transduction histidine kinase